MSLSRAVALTLAVCAAPLAAQRTKTKPTTPAKKQAAPPKKQTAPQANTLTSSERAVGWRLLFDGKTLRGWRGLGYDDVPTAHWKVVDGAIKKVPTADVANASNGKPASGGDLITDDKFDDFELAFQWKVTRGANGGVKYNVSEELSLRNNSTHSAIGFEYQVQDDSLGEDIAVPSHRAGALFDLEAPNYEKRLEPVGEWNTSRVLFRGKHIEHWLNGAMVLEFDLGTPETDLALAKSKYRSISGFASPRRGHIALQDHGDEVYYRGIKIREIKG